MFGKLRRVVLAKLKRKSMDKRVKSMVKFFNSIGLKTYMSCSGHFHLDGRQSLFWIEFDSSVTENQIINFYNLAQPRGWLVERILPGPKYNRKSWCYVIGNSYAANKDLKRMKKNMLVSHSG